MNNIFDFFTNSENTLIIGLVFSAILLIIIVLILDYRSRKKEILDDGLLDIKLPMEEDNIDLEQDGRIKEIKYVETNEELEKTKAKLELENLKAELKKEQEDGQRQDEQIKELEESVTNEIESSDKEQTNDKHLNMQDIIDEAYKAEEENAIISISELEAKAGTLYNSEEVRVHEDDTEVPISISELEALYKSAEVKEEAPTVDIEEPIITMQEQFNLNDDVEKENTSFTSTPFISPVYGIDNVKENSLDNINLEQTANLDKLNEELRKVNAFLKELKELKNKLQ